MFELEPDVLEAYQTIPDWAKKELIGRGPCWRYSGNPVLGWIWTPGVYRLSRLEIETDEIPSEPLIYLDISHELIYEQSESMEIDFKRNDNHYCFIINKYIDNEYDVIKGEGRTKLLAAINLYKNVCEYYLEIKTPSVTELDCVDNFFIDEYGHMALSMTTYYAAEVLFSNYHHFVLNHNKAVDRRIEADHGVVKFVEGDVKIYSNYGIKTPKKEDRDIYNITTTATTAITASGSGNIFVSGHGQHSTMWNSVIGGGNLSKGGLLLAGNYKSKIVWISYDEEDEKEC